MLILEQAEPPIVIDEVPVKFVPVKVIEPGLEMFDIKDLDNEVIVGEAINVIELFAC